MAQSARADRGTTLGGLAAPGCRDVMRGHRVTHRRSDMLCSWASTLCLLPFFPSPRQPDPSLTISSSAPRPCSSCLIVAMRLADAPVANLLSLSRSRRRCANAMRECQRHVNVRAGAQPIRLGCPDHQGSRLINAGCRIQVICAYLRGKIYFRATPQARWARPPSLLTVQAAKQSTARAALTVSTAQHSGLAPALARGSAALRLLVLT